MSEYRNIYINLWADPKVKDDFTKDDIHLFLYLLTNPHTNIVGCYEISNSHMREESKLGEEEITASLKRLEALEVIRYSPKTKEVLIVNYDKYNWNKSPKLIKALEKVAKHIKSEEFKMIVSDKIKAITETETDTETDTDTDVSIGYRYPIHTVSKNGYNIVPDRKTNYKDIEQRLLAK